MKYLIITLIAISTMAIQASAQIPAAFNNADNNSLGGTRSSQSDDSVLSRIRILATPASGTILLMVDAENPNVLEAGMAVVYSSGGYPVLQKPFTTGTNSFYVNNILPGLYFMRLIPKNGQIVVKEFIVTR